MNNNSIILYNEGEIKLELNLDEEKETIWATQQQISDLFAKDRDTIGTHIRNIYAEGELDRDPTTAKFAVVQNEGSRTVTRDVTHFNLDMIISIGYRVSSQRATQFRQWATKILKTYIVGGYVLNETRLENDPAALDQLATDVRALRNQEIFVYIKVRDVFKICAADYDPNSQSWQSFYAKLQDKFYYALDHKTGAEIKLERADHRKPTMGLTNFKGKTGPAKVDVTIAKNYLKKTELHTLNIICEQFLLYAESNAFRQKKMTQQELMDKFDALLEVAEYPVLKEYSGFLAKTANQHALRQLELYRSLLSTSDNRNKKLPKKAVGEA